MSPRRYLALAALCLVLCRTAGASEESERLYSRGLIDFHAERYAQALALFEQAVQADSQDLYALYYRGVTHGRLKQFDAAVRDLRAVAQARPDLDQVALELGIALVRNGSAAEAIPWLERAQQTPDSQASASFFLGIAKLRLEDRDGARREFDRAVAADTQLALAAEYYRGVADYQDRDWEAAARHFSAVLAGSPDSDMGHEAAILLQRAQAGVEPRTRVFGEAGMQYDSNVVLAPSDEALKSRVGISRQEDERGFVTVGGSHMPYRSERLQLTVGYEFYQSLHVHLHEFDLQDHRPSALLTGNLGPVRMGLLGYYDYYFLDGSSFLQSFTGFPWVDLPQTRFGRTQLSYRVRWRGFYQQPLKELRNATNHAPGIRHLIPLGAPDRYVLFSYQFDREEPERSSGDAFGYNGHQVAAGIGWTLPHGLTAEAVYGYRLEDYDAASNGRHDHEHRVTTLLEQPLTQHLTVLLAYFGTFNHSNQQIFSYDRNIVSLSLRGRF